MILNEFFDRVYCLNLPRRKDRREHMQGLLAALGCQVEWVDAIDGRGFPVVNGNAGGSVATNLSHARVLSLALEARLHNFLLLEDDVYLPGTGRYGATMLLEQYLTAVPMDWDFCYLGWIPECTHQKQPVHPGLVDKVWEMNGTHAVGIRRSMFAPYLKILLELYWHADGAAGQLLPKVNAYGPAVNILAQGGFGSDGGHTENEQRL